MGKDETLVQKLLEILKSAKPEDIDDSIAGAKRKLAEIAKQNKKKEGLSKLFDTQMQTLENHGCPPIILRAFRDQKSSVIGKAIKMDIPESNIPFLPIIPKSYASSDFQMLMIKNGNQAGFTYLEPDQITDVVQTPNTPYFIFNVEDGREMCGKSPQDAEKLFEKQGRRGLTDTEVVALGVIYTDVLCNHFVDAIGSRYCSNFALSLWLDDGEPCLGWVYLCDALSERGVASCDM
jgi:hypothetical protein